MSAQKSILSFFGARATPSRRVTYQAGEAVLDPQYAQHPADLSAEDRARYFDPVLLTDATCAPAEWLRPYLGDAESPPPAAATPALHPPDPIGA
jgi:hypothetical protein